MKCYNCGKDLPEVGSFCQHCGAKIKQQEAAGAVTQMPMGANPPGKPASSKAKLVWLIVGIAVATVALAAVAIFFLSQPKTVSDEQAEVMLQEVVADLGQNDYRAAEAKLERIRLKEGSRHAEKYAELEEIVALKPEVTAVDTSNYPNVAVTFKVSEQREGYQSEELLVEDDFSEFDVLAFENNGNEYILTYVETEEDGDIDLERQITFARYTQVNFSIYFNLVSRYITYAEIDLVTSNVEAYPEISLYFKVVDEYGDPIENLTEKSFVLKEYLDVNDYLERDVIYAAKVDGQDALNVSLAIDRSDSIDDWDMEKIKSATNTFLSKLQFNSGDKAEIIAFDTNVMQMCLFTNNKDNLMNGVNSMFPYGMTACYDAIVRSIQNASVQSGARCVIVFTDGLDNESVNTVDSVINLAQAKSVPVYTIGVGTSLDESALRRIASSTGGTYHHIDDISSMSEIYDEIYREQKNLYHVKYVSDTALSQDAERTISVWMGGDGYKGYCEQTYTPVVPVQERQHTSRYEVIKADITWEDANRLCIDMGGHLATITSKDEEDKIIAIAEKSGIEKLWIGGYTTNDQNGEAVGHWVMGEPFVYQNWYSEDEPSRFDSDNAAEFYLMLWKIKGRWSWNDQRNDLINSQFAGAYAGKMGYVIEYEE